MANLSFDYAGNNKVAAVKVGDSILITLPENATTGFQWKVASFTHDTLVLEDTDASPASSRAIGAGGSAAIFRFRATHTGRGSIILIMSRGSESDPSATKYTLNLAIS
jgi:inhibitor of cysteine peptidase